MANKRIKGLFGKVDTHGRSIKPQADRQFYISKIETKENTYGDKNNKKHRFERRIGY